MRSKIILILILFSLFLQNCKSKKEEKQKLIEKFSTPLNVQLGYKKTDILVIVNADDIGLHRDQTDASLEAMKSGMCKTGSVMVPCPDFERTAALYKKNPSLDLGIHLTLNSEWEDRYTWKPLLSKKDVPSLYNPKSVMWKNEEELSRNMRADEAYLELEAQIKTALNAGIKPTHLDAHMGSYLLSYELLMKIPDLSRKYKLPFTIFHHPLKESLKPEGFVFPDSVECIYKIPGETFDPALRKDAYFKWLKNLKPGVHQLLVHIADVDKGLKKLIDDPQIRTNDYKVWTSPEMKEFAKKSGIIFIGYRELYNLQLKNMKLLEENQKK